MSTSENTKLNNILSGKAVETITNLIESLDSLSEPTNYFDVVNGKVARGFAEDLGCSEKEAEAFIYGYLDAFPKSKEYLKIVQSRLANDANEQPIK